MSMIEKLELILEEELNARRYTILLPLGAPFTDIKEVLKRFDAKADELTQRAKEQQEKLVEQAKTEAPADVK